MSFDASKLARVGPQNSNAPTLWTYASGADAITAVDASGYFNDAADRLQVGDIIFVVPDSLPAGILTVNANSSGVVDTVNGLSLGSIDSD